MQINYRLFLSLLLVLQLSFAGAVVGASTLIEGGGEVITGKDQLNGIELALVANGTSTEDAKKYSNWIETGVAVITIVNGVAIVSKVKGASKGTLASIDDFAPNRGLDDLVSGGTRRSADDVNATFPDGYSPPYTPGTQVSEFVSDGNQTFVRVVSGDSPGGQWVMKASDIEGLSPQQIADKFALPEVPTGITSVTPPAGIRIRTGEVNPNFGGAGGGTQFQLLNRVNDGWADVTPLQ